MKPQFNKVPLTVALTMLLLGAGVARADITYRVDQTGIGFDNGSVTGTIETDGTTGTLAGVNVLDWDLLVNDGVGTMYTLTGGVGGNSTVAISGNALTATATEFLFNFDLPGDSVDISNGPSEGWELLGGTPPPMATGFEVIQPTAFDGGASPRGLPPQPEVIGTVPEPSTYGPMLIGIGLLMVIVRKSIVPALR
jgi:PEP-CTERM motif